MAEKTIQIADKPTLDEVKNLLSQGISVIKSIQSGIITIGKGLSSGTATITSVNLNKSILLYLGHSTTNSDSTVRPCYLGIKIVLTNATTVTATREGTPPDYPVNVSFMVVEFN